MAFSICSHIWLSRSAQAGLLINIPFDEPIASATRVESTVGGFAFATRPIDNNNSSPFQTAAGVTGAAGDYALDFTSATRMGSGSEAGGPFAGYLSGTGQPIPPQKSLTIAGWLKTDGARPIDNRATLFEMSSLSLNASTTAGALTLSVKDASSTTHSLDSTAAYNTKSEWIFFAVTFDGSIENGDNVTFYIGDTQSPVSIVSSGRIDSSEWEGFSSQDVTNSIRLGNNGSSRVRPFDGYLDNIILYGDENTGAGALKPEQLEALRSKKKNWEASAQ